MRFLEFLVALRPPRHWNIPVLLVLGVLFGLGIGIAHVSRATSYLSDDPTACVNCHIMNPEFASWERGSHARVAVCNDCHVPHGRVHSLSSTPHARVPGLGSPLPQWLERLPETKP